MKTQGASAAAGLLPVAARPHVDQMAAPAQQEQHTGDVVLLEVHGKMVECRIERVLDLEAPQVLLSVCRVISTQSVILRVVSRSGAATVEIGSTPLRMSAMMEAALSLEETIDKEAKRQRKAQKTLTAKKPLARNRSKDRPARQRQLKSR